MREPVRRSWLGGKYRYPGENTDYQRTRLEALRERGHRLKEQRTALSNLIKRKRVLGESTAALERRIDEKMDEIEQVESLIKDWYEKYT